MLTRRHHRFVARLALAALLFAQAILMAEACLLPTPAMPFTAYTQGHHGAGIPAAHACEQNQSMDANACLANFTRGDQATSSSMQLTADVLPAVVIAVVSRDDQPMRVAPPQLVNTLPTEPPPSLRFCSLQL